MQESKLLSATFLNVDQFVGMFKAESFKNCNVFVCAIEEVKKTKIIQNIFFLSEVLHFSGYCNQAKHLTVYSMAYINKEN